MKRPPPLAGSNRRRIGEHFVIPAVTLDDHSCQFRIERIAVIDPRRRGTVQMWDWRQGRKGLLQCLPIVREPFQSFHPARNEPLLIAQEPALRAEMTIDLPVFKLAHTPPSRRALTNKLHYSVDAIGTALRIISDFISLNANKAL